MNKIDQFFNDIDDINNNAKTNIIYLTSKCNMNCRYCFEKDRREQKGFQHIDITCAEIDSFLDEIAEREYDISNHTIVIMGGEPTLRWKELTYLIEQSCIRFKNKANLSLITNGIILYNKLDEYKQLLTLMKENGVSLKLEVSFDYSGNEDRIFPNETESSPFVLRTLNKLNEENVEFIVSYTIHSKNYNTVIGDCIKMFEQWPNMKQIKMNYATKNLENLFKNNDKVLEYKKWLTPYLVSIAKKYNKLICPILCDTTVLNKPICNKCISNSGNLYQIPTKNKIHQEKTEKQGFNLF